MNKIEIDEITLIGLSLKAKTTNKNGQSGIDCGNLWQKFESGNYAEKISGKLTDEILAVYHQYEGDETAPFSYFIGCKVQSGTPVPEDLERFIIPKGHYQEINVKGIMPDCVANGWKDIWKSDVERAFKTDYEVYDERSKDWNNAAVDIFLSVR